MTGALHGRRMSLVQHALHGLSAPSKQLSSFWFYDDEGSRMFQQIMELPEYYLTRVEHQILSDSAVEIANLLAPNFLDARRWYSVVACLASDPDAHSGDSHFAKSGRP